MNADLSHRLAFPTLAILILLLAAVVRTAHLSSDPPPGLSYSRAEYTDEGLKFYQARNRALFGHWFIQTPHSFQGHLTPSPVPTIAGWLSFRFLGVGRVQARLLSVVSGVLSCILLALIGLRTSRPSLGLLAAAFASVNTVLTSYDRLALFEPLAAFFLLLALLTVFLLPGNQILAQIKSRFASPYFTDYPLAPALGDLFVRTLSDSTLAVWTPLLLIIALAALPSSLLSPQPSPRRDPDLLFACWFLASFLAVSFLDYRPTRYFVFLLVPACWLSASWIIRASTGLLSFPSSLSRRIAWFALGFLACIQIMGIGLRYAVANRHDLTLLLSLETPALTSFKDFIESRLIGSRSVPSSVPLSDSIAAMKAHILNLSLAALALLVLALLLIRARRLLLPHAFPPPLRVSLCAALAVCMFVSQAAALLDLHSSHSLRYEVRRASKSIPSLIGPNPRACIAGNWAPLLCMDSPYFTLPFARGGGNSWDTFKRFPVTHLLLERGSPDEQLFMLQSYPSEFSRCSLIASFKIDFYTIDLFVYTPPDSQPPPAWPFPEVPPR